MAALSFVLPVVAPGPAAALDGCPADATQLGLNDCAAAHFRQADAALNIVYGMVIRRLGSDAAGRDALAAAERAWLVFRDAECAFRTYPTSTGSIHGMEVTICRQRLTEERTKTLRSFLSCAEGDMLCPLPPATP